MDVRVKTVLENLVDFPVFLMTNYIHAFNQFIVNVIGGVSSLPTDCSPFIAKEYPDGGISAFILYVQGCISAPSGDLNR